MICLVLFSFVIIWLEDDKTDLLACGVPLCSFCLCSFCIPCLDVIGWRRPLIVTHLGLLIPFVTEIAIGTGSTDAVTDSRYSLK